MLEDPIIIADLQFRIINWNPAAAKLFGSSIADVAGLAIHEAVSLQFQSAPMEQAHDVLQVTSAWKGTVSYTNAAGERFFFQYHIRYTTDANGRRDKILVVCSHVEQVAAATNLQRTASFYSSLVNQTLDGLILMDADGVILFVAPSVVHILGHRPEDVIGQNGFGFIHPDDLPSALYSFSNELADRSEAKYILCRLLKKDGEWLSCMVRAHNLMPNPYVHGMAIYFHDDTPRRQASEALKQSEERFRSLVENLQTGMLVLDASGRIKMSNAAMNTMLGTNAEDIADEYFLDLFKDAIREDGTTYSLEDRPVHQALQRRMHIRDAVIGLKVPSKGLIWIHVNAIPLLDEAGALKEVLCSVTDITERKRLERNVLNEQLVHQRQLTQASIDSQEKERREIGKELHDNIGQQLTTIKLYLDLAKSTADEQTAEMVSLSLRNISDVINEIRSLCRSLIPSSLGDLGLTDSVNDLIYSITRAQQLSITLDHAHFDEDTVPENQKLMLFRILQEQLNNIVKHADASHVTITLRNDAGELCMDVIDDGKGFDPANVRLGIGLVNMRNRAEMFGGSAIIETAPGKGCSLQVRVPGAD